MELFLLFPKEEQMSSFYQNDMNISTISNFFKGRDKINNFERLLFINKARGVDQQFYEWSL